MALHLEHYASGAFLLTGQWAVGVATSVAMSDAGTELVPSQPPRGLELAAQVVPALVAMALGAPFAVSAVGHAPGLPANWILAASPLLLPFGVLSWVWGQTWVTGRPAVVRRRWGLAAMQAGIFGLVLGVTIARYLGTGWRGGVLLANVGGAVAALGGLTHLSLLALGLPVPGRAGRDPAPVVYQVTQVGLVLTALALTDMVWLWAGARGTIGPETHWLNLAWLLGALVLPGLGLLVGLRAPGTRPAAWPAALVCALAGHGAAATLIFHAPRLVPPLP